MSIQERLREVQVLVTDHSGVNSDDSYLVAEANRRMVVARGGESFTYKEWRTKLSSSAFTFLSDRGYTGLDPAEVQAEYAAIYRQLREDGQRPIMYPDAPLFYARRKKDGCANIILSSHPKREIEQELIEFGIIHLFDDVIGDVEDKAEGLKKLLGCSAPRRMSYQGDMAKDIIAAKSAGLLSIGITTGYHDRPKLEVESPDLLVDSLTELDQHFGRTFAHA